MTPAPTTSYCRFVIGEYGDVLVLCGAQPASFEDADDGTPLCDADMVLADTTGRRVRQREERK